MAGTKVLGYLFLAVFLVAAFGTGCKTRHRSVPRVADSGPAKAKGMHEKAPKAVKDLDAVQAKAATSGHTADASVAGVPSGAGAAKGDKRKRLWECYQEVYCAQKKGEMDKILDIYKKYGFETPKQFTAAWTEAAKDTEWLSRLAHDVSKKCK